MDPTVSAARLEFQNKARLSPELAAWLADELRRKEREKKEDREDEQRMEFVQLVLATENDVTDFTVKLDQYDTATVEALMANEIELKEVRERLEEMLLEAHTLPDGRRVFKTRDGTRVFDESGLELKADEIRPNEIDDAKPRWEDLREAKSELHALETERAELIEYQDKLDKARDRLDDPNLTKDDLDALDKELGKEMPDRVRAKINIDGPGVVINESSADLPEQRNEPVFSPAVAHARPTP